MKLTAENVNNIVADALFRDNEVKNGPPAAFIEGDGILRRFAFHPERLETNRENIRSMLQQLDSAFQAEGGGGMSFLAMCVRADGVQWAEQSTCATLCALGTALGFVTFPLPREMWNVLPGGVPYVTVNTAAGAN